MSEFSKILGGTTSLWANAHPDDVLTEVGAINELDPSAPKHMLVASLGRLTTINNYRVSYPGFTQDGGRFAEALGLNNYLRFSTTELHDYPDGKICGSIPNLAQAILKRAIGVGATVLISTLGLRDHPDHIAMGEATDLAGKLLALELGVPVTMVQFYNPGEIPPEGLAVVTAPAAPSHALSAAMLNRSQHEVLPGVSLCGSKPEGWLSILDDQYVVSPRTMADFSQYSIFDTTVATVEIVHD